MKIEHIQGDEPLIKKVKTGIWILLSFSALSSLSAFKSYTDEAMIAHIQGERTLCIAEAEFEEVFYKKLRYVKKSPLYTSSNANGLKIISNENFEIGIAKQCLKAKDFLFVYNDESFYNFVDKYDRTYSFIDIVMVFVFFILGVVHIFWYIYLKRTFPESS